MSADVEVVFLNAMSLGGSRGFADVVRSFVDYGFTIDQFEVAGKVVSWQEYTSAPEDLIALANKSQELAFDAFNPNRRLSVRQQIGWGGEKFGAEGRSWARSVTGNTPYFWRKEYQPEIYSRLLLDLGKRLYESLRPSFGWCDFNYGVFTTHDDVEALELPMLYWANFFGPDYVHKFGSDKLRGAPAWTVEELADGGLLYVLASGPGLANEHVPVDAVKTYFGVEQVR